MRWRRCFVIFVLFFLMLMPSGIHAETMDGAIGNGNSPGETEAEKNDEAKADANTSDFLSGAILSLDEEVRKKEAEQDYIKNFYNSSMTAKTKGLNLLDGDSIITCFLNLITTLFETIGFVISFFVMTIYNLVSSSFLSTIIQEIFDVIDGVLFDWDDPDSWINKVLLIAALSSILYKLIKDFTRIVRWQQIIEIILTAFLSMTFITFIGQNGRKIANGFEETTSQLLTETFVFGDSQEDPEIANKQNIFDILQRQPFMVRHFGTTDLVKIAGSDDKEAIEKAEKRVQRLLNEPSQDNAEDEYDRFGNRAITHDGSSAMEVMSLSFVLLIHRGAISIVLAAICIILGAVKAAKYIVLGLSVYQLIWWLLKHGRKARQWFLDRLMWCMVTIVADILFSTALFFLVELCTKVSSYSVLLMLAVDAILILLLRFVIKNLSTIISALKEDGKLIAEGMLMGTSPMSTFRKLMGSDPQNDTRFDRSDGADTESGSGNGYSEGDDRELQDREESYDSSYDDDLLRDEHDTMYPDEVREDIDTADEDIAEEGSQRQDAAADGEAEDSDAITTDTQNELQGHEGTETDTSEGSSDGERTDDLGEAAPEAEVETAKGQDIAIETQDEEDLSDEADVSEDDRIDIDMEEDDLSDPQEAPTEIDKTPEDILEDRERKERPEKSLDVETDEEEAIVMKDDVAEIEDGQPVDHIETVPDTDHDKVQESRSSTPQIDTVDEVNGTDDAIEDRSKKETIAETKDGLERSKEFDEILQGEEDS